MKVSIYLDHAASTKVHPEVLQQMITSIQTQQGNPSATHAFGRNMKASIELARKIIAKTCHCDSSEIFFTSGGTEGNNWILRNAVKKYGIQRIITQSIEHKSVLETVLDLAKSTPLLLEVLPVKQDGEISYELLENQLQNSSLKTLVSIMHCNNETGIIGNIEKIGQLTKQYNALFHSDMVQSMGHLPIDFSSLAIDFATSSAHKFHGPQGVGFAYISKKSPLTSLLTGGNQEKGKRAGTENVVGIVGLHKAFELAHTYRLDNEEKLAALRLYTQKKLLAIDSAIEFTEGTHNANHILGVILPKPYPNLLFKLDMLGIAVSSGSACTSGAHKSSHVVSAMYDISSKTFIRVSFSYTNTFEEIDQFVQYLIQSIH